MTATKLAAALGVSRRTIERRIKDGTLQATKMLGATIVSRRERRGAVWRIGEMRKDRIEVKYWSAWLV